MIAEGKKDSAVQVLDKGLYFFPDKALEYSHHTLLYADAYFQCGQREKALEVLESVTENYSQRLQYYYSFRRPKHQRGLREEMQQAVSTLGTSYYMALQYNEKQIAEKIAGTLNQYGVQL